MIADRFPDKASIEKLMSSLPLNTQNGLNGHIFKPTEAFERIIV